MVSSSFDNCLEVVLSIHRCRLKFINRIETLLAVAVVVMSNSSFVSFAEEAPPGKRTKVAFESLPYTTHNSRERYAQRDISDWLIPL